MKLIVLFLVVSFSTMAAHEFHEFNSIMIKSMKSTIDSGNFDHVKGRAPASVIEDNSANTNDLLDEERKRDRSFLNPNEG